jgi:stress response protein SCP2
MNPIILDTSPLVLTQQTKGKVFCGLSWDPKEDPTVSSKITNALSGVNKETYDLDLSCYCYDEHKSLMDFITGNEGEHIDRSGFIKHSGDCRHGEQEGDDEAVTIDLAALPDYIQHLVFIAEVGSAHSFSNVLNPYIRIADEMSDQELDSLTIPTDESLQYSACVYATLSRRKDGSWLLHRNRYYLDHEDIESWPDFLSQFIST